MSSRKIPMKFRVDEELRKKFFEEMQKETSKPSLMLEQILRERYKLPRGEQGVKENAKQ